MMLGLRWMLGVMAALAAAGWLALTRDAMLLAILGILYAGAWPSFHYRVLRP